MAGPWEKYKQSSDGPWAKYTKPAEEPYNALESALSTAGGIVAPVASKLDSVTGAPVRAAIGELQKPHEGEWWDPRPALSAAGQAYKKQFAADPSLAPTGHDLAKNTGLSDDKMFDIPVPGTRWKIPVSPAGAAGVGLDVATDPVGYLGGGPVRQGLKGLAKATKAGGTELAEYLARKAAQSKILEEPTAASHGLNLGKNISAYKQAAEGATGAALGDLVPESVKNAAQGAADLTKTAINKGVPMVAGGALGQAVGGHVGVGLGAWAGAKAGGLDIAGGLAKGAGMGLAAAKSPYGVAAYEAGKGALAEKGGPSGDQILARVQGTKYAPVFQAAQSRGGDQSVSANYFLLGQTDPEFRQLFQDEP